MIRRFYQPCSQRQFSSCMFCVKLPWALIPVLNFVPRSNTLHCKMFTIFNVRRLMMIGDSRSFKPKPMAMPLFSSVLLLVLLSFGSTVSFSQTDTVYITKTGEKYHTKTHYAAVTPIELSDAIEKGYTACKVCKPSSGTAINTLTTPAATRSTSTQCNGTTKAGTRCKRMTTNANGYCYQHQ